MPQAPSCILDCVPRSPEPVWIDIIIASFICVRMRRLSRLKLSIDRKENGFRRHQSFDLKRPVGISTPPFLEPPPALTLAVERKAYRKKVDPSHAGFSRKHPGDRFKETSGIGVLIERCIDTGIGTSFSNSFGFFDKQNKGTHCFVDTGEAVEFESFGQLSP